jgi:putative membrane protein
VIASILAVSTHIKWSLNTIATLVVGTVVAFIIVNLAPVEVEPTPLNLFFAGMIAICAMILPGISGSFILLIMGQYDNVLSAVTERDFVTVGIVFAGTVLGIVLFSRVLSWLLTHRYQMTIAALVGFMIGSLWKIWPWKECIVSDLDRHGDFRCLQEANLLPDGASNLALAVGLMIFGFVLVSFMDHLQSRNNPLFSRIWPRAKSSVSV